MKRVKAACITQTLHFQIKDGISSDFYKRAVRNDVEKYKMSLEKSRTKYKILSEEVQDDGSIIIEIKKQYNASPVGDYLN